MAAYVTGERICKAVERLRKSRAAAGFVNFLILKRAIEVDPDRTVKLSKNDKHFQQAIDELTLWPVNDYELSPPRPFVDVFGSMNATNNGTKLEKYRSNGPADTYKGSWDRIVNIHDGDPSKIAVLKDNYIEGLKERTVLKDPSRPMPLIRDTAIWYFRRENITEFIGGEDSDEEVELKLVSAFIDRLKLTEQEIAILFAAENVDNVS